MTRTILDLVGNTPLVPIRRLNPYKKVEILAKLESFNPGGSVKDRIALNMIEAAEAAGLLTPDKIVLEATSGNTGIGLAMVCAVKGYRCMLVMPESASIERRKIMAAYGAEILLTPAKKSTDGAIEQSYALARQHPDRYFLTDQFNNEANWQAHYKRTGPEIWEGTSGRVTDVVATLGTSGTAMGLCRYFAENHPEVRVTAVEPFMGHRIQGLKNMKESYRPGIFDKNAPHRIINVPDDEAFAMARRLASREGIFSGMSSGAALCAALARAEQIRDEGGVIVVILPDGGERYLSTVLYDTDTAGDEACEPLPVKFFNSMSRRKEVFRPARGGEVTFYACGPTANGPLDLGHCRRFVHADLVRRFLESRGYEVRMFMNFTDLDDTTIAGAMEAGRSVREYTDAYIESFMRDIEKLGIKPATGYPRPSGHVDEMIAMSEKLVEKGYAYEKHGSVYFDISKFSRYGRLSRVDLSRVQPGRTVDLDDYDKDSPLDFTLLKRSTLAELKDGIFFESRWGNVRPGWHIECAAMCLHYLGGGVDLHYSSRNLIFPHHENEIAIAESLTGRPLARHWMHSELLLNNGRKLGPGNLVTLADVEAAGFTARELRFFLLRTHYRKPVDFSLKRLEAAARSLARLDDFCARLLCLPPGLPHPEVATYVSEMEERVNAALCDDLNVSRAFAAIFDLVKRVNPIIVQGNLDREQKGYLLDALKKVDQVFNVLKLEQCPLAPEIDRLIREREEARRRGDFAAADRVRDELSRKGIRINDTASGTVWKEE